MPLTSRDRRGDGPGNMIDPARRYPIRTVAELTGVLPVTLRAWERRYNLVRPRRTEKGHRLYTDADVARIRRVLGLLEEGIPVSRVGPLLDAAPVDEPATTDNGDNWSRYHERMRQALIHFDDGALDAVYNDALSLYPIDLVTRNLTTPLMRDLGATWRNDPAGIAREHFFSAYLRNKLGARFQHLNTRAGGDRLVAACPAGEHHDLGLILFALNLAGHGYHVVVLGADLPSAQIVEAAHIARGRAILLAATAAIDVDRLTTELACMVADSRLPVLLGGEASVRFHDQVSAAGAVALGSDFNTALDRMARSLAAR